MVESRNQGSLLHVIDTGGAGGAETVFARVIAATQDGGWLAVPVISREGWLAETLRAQGFRPIIQPAQGSVQIGYLRAIIQIARSRQVKCILAHLYGASLYAAIAGLLAHVPVIAVLHGHSDVQGPQRLPGVKRFLLRHGADRVVFVSDALKENLQPLLRLRDNQCIVIPNGVDIERFQPRREPDDGVPRPSVVGAVGNIRRPKAYDVLLQAARRVVDVHPDVRFKIAGQGDGPLMSELLVLRDRLGLNEHVHFLGMVTDISTFLQSLDIYILTSETEGFSISLVEAMASGLPVVATRSGGPETILDSESCGRLVPVGDAEALAVETISLIEDPSRRRKMGAAARVRAESEYGLSRMTEAYLSLIKDCVRRR